MSPHPGAKAESGSIGAPGIARTVSAMSGRRRKGREERKCFVMNGKKKNKGSERSGSRDAKKSRRACRGIKAEAGPHLAGAFRRASGVERALLRVAMPSAVFDINSADFAAASAIPAERQQSRFRQRSTAPSSPV